MVVSATEKNEAGTEDRKWQQMGGDTVYQVVREESSIRYARHLMPSNWMTLHKGYHSNHQALPCWLSCTDPPALQETQVWSLGWEDPLEKEMATHSRILAWKSHRISHRKEPGWPQSVHGVVRSQMLLSTHTHTHTHTLTGRGFLLGVIRFF